MFDLNIKIQMFDLNVKIQMTYFEIQVSKVGLQMSNINLFVGDNSNCATQPLSKLSHSQWVAIYEI